MEKCAVFIDGGYFNKCLKKYFSSQGVDYLKFSEEICMHVGAKRLRTYFYHCLPFVREGSKEDEKRHSSAELFLTKLKRLSRFEVKLGKLQLIGGQFKQKMIDVLMSLDIVDMCFNNQISQAIIVAGDSDFIPALKKAKDCGAIIHLFYHPDAVHNELLDIVDELHEIDRELIKECGREK
jgi:uncharacterized LabA/DUF88 family protein